MSNERTVPVEAEGLRLLTDSELDAVSGGAGLGCLMLEKNLEIQNFPAAGAAGIANALTHVPPCPPG